MRSMITGRPAYYARGPVSLKSTFSMLRPQSVVRASSGLDEISKKTAASSDDESKSKTYTEIMNARMGSALTYNHEAGINYAYVTDDLICGSCPQSPADIDLLAEKENVDVIFSLQEDCDTEYFKIEILDLRARAKERGDIEHVRCPIRDFDPFDLRKRLPRAVTRLALAKGENKKAYIHCTAGLGRAPGTLLAYMYWVKGIPLETAYEMLYSVRRCNPKLEAIRAATLDILTGAPLVPVTISSNRMTDATTVQIAGLDVGWGNKIDLRRDRATGRWILERELAVGAYQYKWVIDGKWTYSADHPTILDGGNTNNIVAVLARGAPEEIEMASRILQPQRGMTTEEMAKMREIILSGKFLTEPSAEEEEIMIDANSEASRAARVAAALAVDTEASATAVAAGLEAQR